jgi:hypothetical protein
MTEKMMIRLLAVITLLLIAHPSIGWAAETPLGICDGGTHSSRQTKQYNVESRTDTDMEFIAKLPCSDELITIKRCAISATHNARTPRYCYSSDRPTYMEYTDVVEYWDLPKSKGTDDLR